MLDLKGNTAVYMLYAHARIAGIIRKGKKDVAEVAKTAHISLDHASEVRAAATCTKCRAISRAAISRSILSSMWRPHAPPLIMLIQWKDHTR